MLGGSGSIGGKPFLSEDATQTARLVWGLACIVLPVFGFFLSRWLTRIADGWERRLKARLLRRWRRNGRKWFIAYRVLLVFAVLGASLPWIATENKFAIGFWLMNFFTVQPLLGALLAVRLTSRWQGRPWQSPVMFITGAGAVAVAVAVAGALGCIKVLCRRTPLRPLATAILGGLTSFAIFVSLYDRSKMQSEFAVFALLLFLILPIANGLFDWLSWWATRALGRRLLGLLQNPQQFARRLVTVTGHGLADVIAAGGLLLAMAFSLAFGFSLYNELGFAQLHESVFSDLPKAIKSAADHPASEGFWLAAMLFTTLIPTFGHGAMLLASPLGLVLMPNPKRLQLAANLDNYANAGDLQSSIRRETARWLVHGQWLNYLVAIVLLAWLLLRYALLMLFPPEVIVSAAEWGIAAAHGLAQMILT
ncbi:MAG: hypothetical protein ACXWT3_14260 [Methylococcaceae bacterium]